MDTSIWMNSEQIKQLPWYINTETSTSEIIMRPAQDSILCTGNLWALMYPVEPAELEENILKTIYANQRSLSKVDNVHIFRNTYKLSRLEDKRTLDYFIFAKNEGLVGDTRKGIDFTTDLLSQMGINDSQYGCCPILFEAEGATPNQDNSTRYQKRELTLRK